MKQWVAILWLVFVSACGTATPLDPNAAAWQSQQQAQYYAMLATGTQVAYVNQYVVPMTSTSAAVSIQQTSAVDTLVAGQYTQSAMDTAVAKSWTPTLSPTPTPNATQTLIFDAVQRQLEDSQRRAERADLNNRFYALLPGVLFAVVVGALLIGLLWWSRRERYAPAPVNADGEVIPLIDRVHGTVTHIDRMPNYRGQVHEDLTRVLLLLLLKKLDIAPELPLISEQRQAEVTKLDQLDTLAQHARLPRRLLEEQGLLDAPKPLPMLQAPQQPLDTNFLLPDWQIIYGWDGKKGIPYYTHNGLDIIDRDSFPHLSTLGITGSGKSRRFFRPVIASVLALGDRVIIVGKAKDFWVFQSHPNATLIQINQITDQAQAEWYARILEGMVDEMNRRDEYLTSSHKSTWARAGRETTYLFLDELGNTLNVLDQKDRTLANRIRGLVLALVQEGRAAGFNVAISNQRATGMAAILSQTGKAIFCIDADEERHHRSLKGASTLSAGYFIARFGASQTAGAFEPTEADLQKFMETYQAKPLDKDDWIDGVLVQQPELSEVKQPVIEAPQEPPTKADSMNAWLAELNAKEPKSLTVIELYQSGIVEPTEIARSAYGYDNGRVVSKVNELIAKYRQLKGIPTTTATTTTATTPNSHNLGSVAA